tara:strand:+ start:12090 stop:13133 length:1044 start_codon:yes stop_codon:yes gene_type:complete
MKKLATLFCFLLFSIFINAQVVNSNEKSIGAFYNATVNQLKLDGGKIEFQLRLKKPNETIYTKKEQISAIKSKTWFLNLGITNTKSFLSVNDFDFNSVGYKGGITFQNSFNKIYLDKNESLMTKKLFTSRIGGEIQLDRFKNYNPNSNMVTNALPITINFNANFNYYFFNTSFFKVGTMIPGLNLELTPITYNSSSLENYISSTNTTSINNVFFTKNKSFDGKYGVLENRNQASFISFSSPFIFDKKILNSFYFTPIPHVSWQTIKGGKPSYNVGFAFGFLNKPIKGSIENVEDKIYSYKNKKDQKVSKKYRKFNVPSFLSFGIDWNYHNGKESSPNYFITGSFSLD